MANKSDAFMAIQRVNVREYGKFATLVKAIDDYTKKTEGSDANLLYIARLYRKEGLPLPSGGYGNPLAVALEMNQYVGALYLLKNNGKIQMDLENVAFNSTYDECYDIHNVYAFSMSYFDQELDVSDDFAAILYKGCPELKEEDQENIQAAKEVRALLQSMKNRPAQYKKS